MPTTEMTLRSVLKESFLESSEFKIAVTHSSTGSPNNERLEYLGDAVLELIISEVLYLKFPDYDEGALTRMRASLVQRDKLAELARRYRLAEWLRLGAGEAGRDNRSRGSILANAFEAVIGALYLVEGIESVRAFVLEIYRNSLDRISGIDVGALKDAKSRLQEYLQAQSIALPEYRMIGEYAGGDERFEVECVIAELSIETRGVAGSKRKAEQAAAGEALRRIEGGGG